MSAWADVLQAVQGRAGWRREGHDWCGPCPVSGDGRNRCHVGPGDRAAVVVLCRGCGDPGSGRLGVEQFLEHLRALGVQVGAGERFPLQPRERTRVEPGPVPAAAPAPDAPAAMPATVAAAIWNLAGLVNGSPGEAYLQARLGWTSSSWPAAVRWLPAGRVVVYPRLPASAVGALVYLFRAAGEDVGALQMEAIEGDGSPVWFGMGDGRHAIKRATVAGCRFADGRRVFRARDGQPGAGAWLVEGPIDALAILELDRLGLLELGSAGILGAAGTAGFRPAAVADVAGDVVIGPDGDPAGADVAVSLGAALQVGGRQYRIRRPARGLDWCDVLADVAAEREAIRDE